MKKKNLCWDFEGDFHHAAVESLFERGIWNTLELISGVTPPIPIILLLNVAAVCVLTVGGQNDGPFSRQHEGLDG